MSTPTPSLEDLRAQAVAVQAPPAEPVVVAPVEPPPPADPWQVKTIDGGNYEVQIEGQVFKGTHQQVLNELAKAQYHATKTIKETRTEYETFKQQHQPPPAPVVPANTEPAEVVAARQYLADETAKALGFKDAAELKQGIQRMNGVVDNATSTNLAATFFQMVPEFPDNTETVEKLYETLNANGLPETPQGLRAAHLIAVAEKKYVPLTVEQIRQQQIRALGLNSADLVPPTPAPMVPSSSSVTTSAPFNPYDPKVPLDKVKEWAQQAQK